ncbi:hypothetical protein [Shimia sediminis]|uniref:hypothetical protein n=1 Tax=Shimia sediminis TaxID=2497945 RepID=UPI000F8C74DF|nr:hypothetical protein [Shimia sediminis]
MNTTLWIVGALVLVIIVAAGAEAYFKSKRHRPLSRSAVQKRRWDDPTTNKAQTHTTIDVETHSDRQGVVRRKSWRVAKDPSTYTKAMMPKKKPDR